MHRCTYIGLHGFVVVYMGVYGCTQMYIGVYAWVYA